MRTHKLPMLKPQIRILGNTLDEWKKRPHPPRFDTTKTLRDKQQANGRTLALNGKAWATLRECVLREQPLCERCMRDDDRPVMATEVDHIDNDPTNNTRGNLQSLCKPCHSAKTMAELHGRPVTVRGCDANGMPLDPHHPWNVEKSPATEADEPTAPLHARSRERIEP